MADDGATDGQPSPLLNPAPGTQTFISTAGGEYVRQLLYVSEPGEAIDEVQRRGALRDAACEPLVGLLDHMGHSRAEVCWTNRHRSAQRERSLTELSFLVASSLLLQVYHEMLNSALELLKRRVDTMSTPALERLLDVRSVFCLLFAGKNNLRPNTHPHTDFVSFYWHRGVAADTTGSSQSAEPGAGQLSEAGVCRTLVFSDTRLQKSPEPCSVRFSWLPTWTCSGCCRAQCSARSGTWTVPSSGGMHPYHSKSTAMKWPLSCESLTWCALAFVFVIPRVGR